jgi:hypothetical protein
LRKQDWKFEKKRSEHLELKAIDVRRPGGAFEPLEPFHWLNVEHAIRILNEPERERLQFVGQPWTD